MLGIAAGDRMVLELAEVAREGHVLGARDVLVAEEQHLVLEQQGADLGHQAGVARGGAEVRRSRARRRWRRSAARPWIEPSSRAVLDDGGRAGFDAAGHAVIWSLLSRGRRSSACSASVSRLRGGSHRGGGPDVPPS